MLRKMRWRMTDDVEDDDVEDDDVEKGMMRMLRMMVLRKRKMMMLMTIMMWRRRTEPKTATTVFAQACAVEMHLDMSKSHFTREFTQKNRRPDGSQDRDPHFVRACGVEMHLAMSQQPFYARI